MASALGLDTIERTRLVKRADAARILAMSPKTWDKYWLRHPDLRAAVRTTHTPDPRPGRGRGQPHRKWLYRALVKHIEQECR